MRYHKEIITRIAEGLAPVASEDELVGLRDRLDKPYPEVEAFASAVHEYYQELMAKRDIVEIEPLAHVQKPKYEGDLAIWIEDLEEACLPALQQYLEC